MHWMAISGARQVEPETILFPLLKNGGVHFSACFVYVKSEGIWSPGVNLDHTAAHLKYMSTYDRHYWPGWSAIC